MVPLPNGTFYGPVVGPVTLTLAEYDSVDRNRVQNVPANAPAGEYIFYSYIGTYPGSIACKDSIEFEKLSSGEGKWVSGWTNESINLQDVVLPAGYSLCRIFPNPFNQTTVIRFELKVASLVKLEVFNVSGRTVGGGSTPALQLINGWREAGRHEVTFDGSGLASGIYLAKIEVSDSGNPTYTAVQKLVLMKQPQATSHKLQATSYKLQATSFKRTIPPQSGGGTFQLWC